MRRTPWIEALGVGVLAVSIAALVVLDARNETLRAAVVPTTITWIFIAFVGYALVLATREMAGRGRDATVLDWRLLIAVGLIARLGLLFTDPTLSDDVYRYLWEGHLVTEGVSPYAFAIDDPAGDAYDIGARSLANNTSLASPYLPVAHGVFGAAAFVLPSEPWTMQLIMVAFDVLALAMIVRLLDVVGLRRDRALLYWLNPLVIVEVAHGAHLDAMIVGLGLAGVALTLSRPKSASFGSAAGLLGPVLVGLATLTRPLAVLLLPVLFWQWHWPQRIAYAVTVGVPVAVTGAVSGFGLGDDGVGVFGSARAYTDTFRFNSGIYHWVETWIGGRGLDDKGWNEPVALTRLIIGAVVALALLVIFVRARSLREPRKVVRALAVPVMVYVLFTPVLHPWYLLLLLALVPMLTPGDDEQLGQWAHALPWLALSALVVLSYLTYEDPAAFAERGWVRNITWIPTFTMLAVLIVRGPRLLAARR